LAFPRSLGTDGSRRVSARAPRWWPWSVSCCSAASPTGALEPLQAIGALFLLFGPAFLFFVPAVFGAAMGATLAAAIVPRSLKILGASGITNPGV